MPKIAFKSIDDYIDAQPETSKPVLHRLRSIIRKALPTAEEVISYGMPAYKLHGRVLLFFAGWKEHYSLYPAGDLVVATFKDQLARYTITKGTIRFPLSDPIPAKLIERIAKFRANEVASRAKSKVAEHRVSKKIKRPQTRPSPVIPPLSVVKIIKVTRHEPAWRNHKGKIFRIGYYSKQDGLDCVWLVDDEGKYKQTVDQEMIKTHFEILKLSDETDFFGADRANHRPKVETRCGTVLTAGP